MGKLISVLKVVVPLCIGIFVIWYQYHLLSPEDIGHIKESFANANYFWVGLSVLLGVMSHLSRAYRWKYTLEPLRFRTRFINNFFGVMIGYVANIVLPRLGEVWRCVLVSRYEKVPFEKLFGTVVAERVADMLVLFLIVVAVLIMQIARLKAKLYELLQGFMEHNSVLALTIKLAVGLGVLVIAAAVLMRLIRRSEHPLFQKVRKLLSGLRDGVTSILRMKKKWAFFGHTVFIWTMYLAMFYVPFMALPGTAVVSLGAVLASFVMASFSIILVQGGIGVYPVAVAQTLVLYGITYTEGFAMGWIIWASQTIMIVSFGVGSMILMPIINHRNRQDRPNN